MGRGLSLHVDAEMMSPQQQQEQQQQLFMKSVLIVSGVKRSEGEETAQHKTATAEKLEGRII